MQHSSMPSTPGSRNGRARLGASRLLCVMAFVVWGGGFLCIAGAGVAPPEIAYLGLPAGVAAALSMRRRVILLEEEAVTSIEWMALRCALVRGDGTRWPLDRAVAATDWGWIVAIELAEPPARFILASDSVDRQAYRAVRRALRLPPASGRQRGERRQRT